MSTCNALTVASVVYHRVMFLADVKIPFTFQIPVHEHSQWYHFHFWILLSLNLNCMVLVINSDQELEWKIQLYIYIYTRPILDRVEMFWVSECTEFLFKFRNIESPSQRYYLQSTFSNKEAGAISRCLILLHNICFISLIIFRALFLFIT